MQLLKFVSLFALAGATAAHSLLEVLAGNPDLSSLVAFVKKYPDLVQALSTASNITVLAPTNAAFAAFQADQGVAAELGNPEFGKAVLQYHVLKGVFPAASIPAAGAFVPTLLSSTPYSNVSGGQRVEAKAVNGGVTFTSGPLKTSKVTQAVSISPLFQSIWRGKGG